MRAKLLFWSFFIVLGVFLRPNIIWPQEEAPRGRVPFRKLKVVAILDRNEEGRPFSFPVAIGIDPYTLEIYVVESSRLVVFSPDFFPRFSLGKGRGILAPYGVAIDEDGRVYVCQGVTGLKLPRLSILNGAGILEKEIIFKELSFENSSEFHPRSVAVDKRFIYVTGEGFEGVVVLNKAGRFVKLLEVKDRVVPGTPEKRARIKDVYVDRKGRLYLLSEEMGRFYVFDSLGHFLFKGGVKGGGPGKLSRPRGIAADPSMGLILVIDYLRHTGLAYSYDNGRFLFEFGGRGWAPGWFNYPTDIEIDTSGRIYVADLFNRRVQVLIFGEEEGVVSPTPSFITPLKKIAPRTKPSKSKK